MVSYSIPALGGVKYLFADPISRVDSGISSYVHNAVRQLLSSGLDAQIISKEAGESIERYRQRLAEYVRSAGKSGTQVIVEAPETGAVTADIAAEDAAIHIRLHCSRSLGALMQGNPICKKSLEIEQREIERASYLSAPSVSAVVASKAIFQLPDEVCCYPNPAPAWPGMGASQDQTEPAYALFVGRQHPLKGAHWIWDLAKLLPDIPFQVVAPLVHGNQKTAVPRNLTYVEGRSADRLTQYLNARLVFIPSLYETASMVGIEALTVGVPVVSWSHLGIAEYGSQPDVTTVEAWDLDAFSQAVDRIFHRQHRKESGTNGRAQFNELYLKGFRTTIEGGKGNFMPESFSKNASDVIDILTKDRTSVALALPKTTPRWRRKLQKLRRDPALFFRDSWLARAVVPSGQGKVVVRELPKEAQKITEEKPGPDEEAKAKTKAGSEQKLSPSKEPVKSSDWQKTAKKENPPVRFAKIDATGRIEFGEPPSKPEGLITAFLYPGDREQEAAAIIAGLQTFSDFPYAQQPMLQIGSFQTAIDGTAVEFIERIDLKNKKLISSVDHLVLLDPPPVLVQGLRSSGTRQRTVVISSGKEQLPDPWHTDVLILVSDVDASHCDAVYRRKIIVKEHSQLHFAIRRAVQEGAPKNPDMLLPLFGFAGDHRDELLAVDVRFFQGIVRVPTRFSPKGKNMEELCLHMADKAKAMAVTESTYLRYRSLCDRIEDRNVLARLLSFALFDGVILDVRA